MSKDMETPAADGAAGESLIPETDQAVLLMYGRYGRWLQENLGDELNGKQIRAAAAAALQLIVPIVRAAAITDLADACAGTPGMPGGFPEVLREAATQALQRDAGVANVGS